jgi:hypothetical protein
MQVGVAGAPRRILRSSVQPGDVIIVPITTRPPERDAVAIELKADEKRACGLDPGTPSWVIVSEFNADMWPNADIVPISDGGRFQYGRAPPGLLQRIVRAFLEANRNRNVVGVRR